MHVNIVVPLACVTFFLIDSTLLSVSPVGRGILVKIVKSLKLQGIFSTDMKSIHFNIV